ncbi:hypothetical protein AWC05_08275 [Mycobacterium florentinum]|uniref:Twin-arginine translocation pathway signal n=1 Tax=Mycobacterium florentinum TaxID=292462 RepID=A0A1X1UL74_MYCFL|nr:hypothetical protein [Mycobacterium florentinum]MCV7408186.1 hypothetical protein [Mycobacterium florentinum]ORV57541.1 hypothetical protein AWC05_08275 [Mycobacterium florentinum]BBX78593.1 hypothetical protein MFLOJ_23800 [Mycobacterium florentinum]
MTTNENLAAVDLEEGDDVTPQDGADSDQSSPSGRPTTLRRMRSALGRPMARLRTRRAVADPDSDSDLDSPQPGPTRRDRGVRVVGVGVFVLVAALSGVAAYAKYLDACAAAASRAAVESVQAAKDSTVAMLSYTPDSVEQKLTAASDRLTGTFHDSYASLIHDVVIPGAREKKISAAATVAAAASESASASHAVVVLFVNQAVMIGNDAPTQTASVVEVTLDKLGNRWLVAGFEPK